MDLYEIRHQLMAGKTIFDIPLRVTYYARVSTDKEEQLHSLSAQTTYFVDFIHSIPSWTFVDGYYDEGISGTTATKRERFISMIEDARLGKFDFILTKEISRFSRNTVDSIHYTQELLRFGVGVYFQSDNINTLEPDAELRLTIMASIAQDEVRKLSERTKFGFKRSIEKGVVLGSNNIWGYTKQKGKLVINEEEAKIVKQIFDLYATQGMGVRKICQYLTENGVTNQKGKPMSFSSIRGILSNPKYKRYYCGNKTHKVDYKLNIVKYLDEEDWVMYKDEESVPPIVSEEIWDRANSILEKRSAKQSSENKGCYSSRYAYSGKILCAEHNIPFYRVEYHYKTCSKEVWQCKSFTEKGKAGCDSPTIYTSELNDIMQGIVKTIKIDKAKIINDMMKLYTNIGCSTNIKTDIAKAKTQINEVLARKDKLLDLSLAGRISDEEFEKRNSKFNGDIDELNCIIDHLNDEELKSQNLSDSINTLRDIITEQIDFLDEVPDNVIEALLDKIVVSKTEDKNKIHLDVYLKVLNNKREFEVVRSGRNKTSVCTELCI